MIPSGFKDYFNNCDSSTRSEIVAELLSMLESPVPGQFEGPRDERAVGCPHCKSGEITANGRLKGIQRYRCKACGKNFSETTGKFWYNLQKRDKVSHYLYCMLSGLSIKKTAKQVGIAVQTSFDWRHKLLTAFSTVSPEGFEGIVESDDLFFAHSEKGSRDLDRPARKRGQKASKAGISDQKVAVIATCDRSGNRDFKVATRGRISKKDIERAIGDKVGRADVLCSDAHRSYTAFAKGIGAEHKKFNASKGQRTVERAYHVQNVNAMDQRLRKFMAGFNGVATKYLQNYLNWFLVLEKVKRSTERMATMAAIALASNTAWFEYKQGLYNMLIRT